MTRPIPIHNTSLYSIRRSPLFWPVYLDEYKVKEWSEGYVSYYHGNQVKKVNYDGINSITGNLFTSKIEALSAAASRIEQDIGTAHIIIEERMVQLAHVKKLLEQAGDEEAKNEAELAYQDRLYTELETRIFNLEQGE